MCEWNLLCDASSTPPNTCSGFSVFDFHSRMKSIFVSFSRLPILYYRRREFGGCKSPFSRLPCCYSRTQYTAALCFLSSHNKNTETRESSVLVLTSQALHPQSPVLRGFVPNRKWNYTYLTAKKEGKKNRYGVCFFDFHTRTTRRFDQVNKKKSVIYTLNSGLY